MTYRIWACVAFKKVKGIILRINYPIVLYYAQVRSWVKKVGGRGLIIVFHIVTGVIDVIYA